LTDLISFEAFCEKAGFIYIGWILSHKSLAQSYCKTGFTLDLLNRLEFFTYDKQKAKNPPEDGKY
jgi:hypothetical protein